MERRMDWNRDLRGAGTIYLLFIYGMDEDEDEDGWSIKHQKASSNQYYQSRSIHETRVIVPV
jgi:hypothetical protein